MLKRVVSTKRNEEKKPEALVSLPETTKATAEALANIDQRFKNLEAKMVADAQGLGLKVLKRPGVDLDAAHKRHAKTPRF